MARVLTADGAGRGALSIAGAVLEAELPAHLRPGQDVRLVVREVTAERVVLGLGDQVGMAPVAAPAVPLPGGGRLQVVDEQHRRGSEGDRGGRDVVTIRYEAPNLGAVDLRFDLRAESLHVTVGLADGEPLRRGQAGAVALREALQAAADRSVTLTLRPRREPLDVYA
jgi:hypothetical protein